MKTMVDGYRYIRGYVCFHATGSNLEKLINMIGQQDIKVWRLYKKNGVLKGCTKIATYSKLSKISKKAGCRIRIQKKIGLPFRIDRYHDRLGFYIGIAVFALMIAIMPSFIWEIEVVGNEKILSQEIINHLEKAGVHEGVFYPTLKIAPIQKQLAITIPDLSFFAINRSGSKLIIDVREMKYSPEMIPKDEPCNIVAAKTGQIIATEVYTGKKIAKVGDVVREGELLVSGVADYEGIGSKFIHSTAKIIAQTTFQKEFVVKFQQEEKKYIDEFERMRLRIFGVEIPLFLPQKLDGSYDITTSDVATKFESGKVPIQLKKDVYREYETVITTLTKQQAEELAMAQAKIYELEELGNMKILSQEAEKSATNLEYKLIITYTCEEDIARSEKILIND